MFNVKLKPMHVIKLGDARQHGATENYVLQYENNYY